VPPFFFFFPSPALFFSPFFLVQPSPDLSGPFYVSPASLAVSFGTYYHPSIFWTVCFLFFFPSFPFRAVPRLVFNFRPFFSSSCPLTPPLFHSVDIPHPPNVFPSFILGGSDGCGGIYGLFPIFYFSEFSLPPSLGKLPISLSFCFLPDLSFFHPLFCFFFFSLWFVSRPPQTVTLFCFLPFPNPFFPVEGFGPRLPLQSLLSEPPSFSLPCNFFPFMRSFLPCQFLHFFYLFVGTSVRSLFAPGASEGGYVHVPPCCVDNSHRLPASFLNLFFFSPSQFPLFFLIENAFFPRPFESS